MQPPAYIVLAAVPGRPGAPLVPASFHGGKTGKQVDIGLSNPSDGDPPLERVHQIHLVRRTGESLLSVGIYMGAGNEIRLQRDGYLTAGEPAALMTDFRRPRVDVEI